MSEQKFTQGKWAVGECRQVLTEDGRTVADAGCSTFPKEEQEANARLIAAAPEMYEMLERLVKWDVNFPVGDDTGRGLKELDSIIAEASAIMKKARRGMTDEQAINILKRVNAWRTGQEDSEYVPFKMTEEALQLAFAELEKKQCFGVIGRLKEYVEYIRGRAKEQPYPAQLTIDIAAAIWALGKGGKK